MDHEDEDSGSEFEISSEEGFGSPDARKVEKQTGSSSLRKGSQWPSRSISPVDEIPEDAAEWAAKFQVPSSPGEIRTPPRKPARERPVTKRKSLKLPPSKVRGNRLKSFYSEDYRQLLNKNIQDAATEMLEEDQYPLEASQIGSSVWTSTEKDIFFSALARIGRDDIRGIAGRIGTKSEAEVHEYILLLHEGMRENKFQGAGVHEIFDLPAAIEISEECCAVLERAGDAIAAREELAAERVEKGRWGDSWLLTKDVSRWIEKRIKKQQGQEEMEEVLPAVNLLNLPNWLELSTEVFMNTGGNHLEDNWTNVAEPGETPSIRATAFQDFHSLTVSITKRLVSTVLFCTMSRLRARDSNLVKHAEVRREDVEAAIKILGLKSDSIQFWTDCARRCHLSVFDDISNEDGSNVDSTTPRPDEIAMTYEAVEADLQSSTRLRSRSRSISRPSPTEVHPSIGFELPDPPILPPDYETPESESESESEPEPESEPETYSSSNEEFSSTHSSRSNSPEEEEGSPTPITGPEITASSDAAHEAYAEILDAHQSRLDEIRLWNMLDQTAPFEIELEPIADLEPPKPAINETRDEDWRRKTEYWAQWETFPTPVREEAFERNRKRVSSKGKRKASVAFPTTDGDVDETSDGLDEGVGNNSAPKRARIPESESESDREDEDEDGSTEDAEDTESSRHEAAEREGNDSDDDMVEDAEYEASDLQDDGDRMSKDQDEDGVERKFFSHWHVRDGEAEDR